MDGECPPPPSPPHEGEGRLQASHGRGPNPDFLLAMRGFWRYSSPQDLGDTPGPLGRADVTGGFP